MFNGFLVLFIWLGISLTHQPDSTCDLELLRISSTHTYVRRHGSCWSVEQIKKRKRNYKSKVNQCGQNQTKYNWKQISLQSGCGVLHFRQCIAEGVELDIICAFEMVLSSAKDEFGGACGVYLSSEWWGGVQLWVQVCIQIYNVSIFAFCLIFYHHI